MPPTVDDQVGQQVRAPDRLPTQPPPRWQKWTVEKGVIHKLHLSSFTAEVAKAWQGKAGQGEAKQDVASK